MISQIGLNDKLITCFNVELTLVHVGLSIIFITLIPLLLARLGRDAKAVNNDVLDISVGLRREMSKSSSNTLSISAIKDDRVIHPINFKQFRVVERTQESYNTVRITLHIPDGRDLGLKIGRHISVKADIEGSKVIRAYTPISKIDQKGSFEILVKRYDYGKLSNHIWNLKKGDFLEIRGPVGRYQWEKNAYPMVGLIAAGSGLTPCLQLIRSSLESPIAREDSTKFVLFYQNRTEEDILMRSLLEELASKYPERLTIVFFISKLKGSRDTWNDTNGVSLESLTRGQPGHVAGYIDENWIREVLHFNKCPHVCVCGPSGFNNAMKDLLCDHGHDVEDSVFIW